MQIKKYDKTATINGAEECSKSDSPASNKTKNSRGIAEAKSQFETPKSNPLFQDSAPPKTRTANCDKTKTPEESGSENSVRNQNPPPSNSAGANTAGGSSTITDGTSNTVIVEEQTSDSPIGDATTPPAQDQQAGTPVTSRDGIINTTDRQAGVVVIDGGSTRDGDGDQRGGEQGVGGITDGTSNTIVVGDQNSDAGTQESTDGQQTSTGTIADGTSNTILIEEQNSDSTSQETAEDQQTPPGTIADGTSNTILIQEEKPEDEKETRPANRR